MGCAADIRGEKRKTMVGHPYHPTSNFCTPHTFLFYGKGFFLPVVFNSGALDA